MRGKCQICGRRRPLKKGGVLTHHHVRLERCTGSGRLPIEEDDLFLETEIQRLRAVCQAKRELIRTLLEQRVNYVDPRHQIEADEAWGLAWALARRLNRHRAWPARYRRQMEREGMAMPPPPYLLARETPSHQQRIFG